MIGKKKERTKKQSIIIFIVLFIACFLLGAAVGHIGFSAGGGGLALGEHIPRLFREGALVIEIGIIIVSLVFVVLMIRYRGNMNRLYHSLSQEQEDDRILNEMDRSISKAGIVMALVTPLELVFMSVLLYIMDLNIQAGPENAYSSRWVVMLSVAFLTCAAGCFLDFFLDRSMVELQKKVNPEKKGELMDLFFHKQWEASSDEAQKLIIYESGYRAHVATVFASYIMEAIAFVSLLVFDTGILPCLFIGVIAITGTFVSALTKYRLESRGWQE